MFSGYTDIHDSPILETKFDIIPKIIPMLFVSLQFSNTFWINFDQWHFLFCTEQFI